MIIKWVIILFDQFKVYEAFKDRENDIIEEFKALSDYNLDNETEWLKFSEITEKEFEELAPNSPARPIDFSEDYIRKISDFELVDSVDSLQEWAVDTVLNSVQSAIDGSQINPSKELSYSIALIQTGHFTINYPKNFDSEETKIDSDVRPKIFINKDSRVNSKVGPLTQGDISLFRQLEEFDYGKKVSSEIAKQNKDAILYIDGTLILSYLQDLNEITSREIITALTDLIKATENNSVALFGYIDTSYAKDLCATINLLNKIEIPQISDSGFLSDLLPNMGDYTIPFICYRNPIMKKYGDYKDKICFSYLRVNSVRPVRIEFPRWIWDKGLYDKFVKLIIANAILGNGYPQVLIRAHQSAVLKGKDREDFNKIATTYIRDNLKLPIVQMIKQKLKHNFS